MENPSQHIYRITYEAFSQFSGSISQARTLDELRACLHSKTKYLFDFRFIRISHFSNNNWVHIDIHPKQSQLTTSVEAQLWPHEEELIKSGYPRIWDGEKYPGLHSLINSESSLLKVWGWHFSSSNNSQLLLSIIGDSNQEFTQKKVPFIKLYIEVIESKILQIQLFKRLADKNNRLNEALSTIQEKNNEIQAIIEHQDAVIAKQTKALADHNKNLQKIAVLNAHNVREPLARILGLMQIADYYSPEDLVAEILPKLQHSSNELDAALRKVIKMVNTHPKT